MTSVNSVLNPYLNPNINFETYESTHPELYKQQINNHNNYNPNNLIDSTNSRVRGIPLIERLDPNNLNPQEITRIGKEIRIDRQPKLSDLTQGASPNNMTPIWSNEEYKYGKNKQNPLNFRPGNDNYEGTCNSNECTPITSLLLPETATMTYTDEFLNQPNSNLFLQNIQPNIYSYAVDTTPINSLASGITYTPQIPPKFRDQVYNSAEGNTYPIYTRIDPQLIRNDGVPARLLEQPVRGDWSAEYSSWQPPEGSVNYEDIYDPRFTGYGDPYRSYSDILLGNVQYYYSDVDAYRMPNFITRSKVDFIEYTNPMGKTMPEYQRLAGLSDTRPFVNNQWTSDSNYFRENLMESQMRPANARAWQQRMAPLSKANHANYSRGVMYPTRT